VRIWVDIDRPIESVREVAPDYTCSRRSPSRAPSAHQPGQAGQKINLHLNSPFALKLFVSSSVLKLFFKLLNLN